MILSNGRLVRLALSVCLSLGFMGPLHALAREVGAIRSHVKEAAFDVRQHLGTKAPYAHRLHSPGAPSMHDLSDPEGYKPLHLYLLSRHGTRWPTTPRAQQMSELENILRKATAPEHAWARNWTLPFKKMPFAAGELHPVGEEELWSLADRLRMRFPELLTAPYFPKRYPVISTHVSRAAQSASAFSLAFFPAPSNEINVHDQAQQQEASDALPNSNNQHTGGRKLKSGPRTEQATAASRPVRFRSQAVALKMAPTKHDPVLRFFDACPAYKQHVDATERWLGPWTMGNWSAIAPRVSARLGLPSSHSLGPCDVDALWQLCSFESGLLGRTDGACSVFSPEEARLLEWLEDVRLWEVQGYGAAINYEIAAPLMADIVRSLKDAASAEKQPLQLARLMFAHCETITPLASLLGLFQPSEEEASVMPVPPTLSKDSAPSPSEAESDLASLDTLDDLPLSLLKKGKLKNLCQGKYRGKRMIGGDGAPLAEPPVGWQPAVTGHDERTWRSGRISPLGGNMALVLYRREEGAAPANSPKHRVRLTWNEQVLQLPGCSELDCDLEEFLAVVTAGHKADASRFGEMCAAAGGNGEAPLVPALTMESPDGLPLMGWEQEEQVDSKDVRVWAPAIDGAAEQAAAPAS